MKKFFAIAVLTGASICAMPVARAQVPHREDAAHHDQGADHRNDHGNDHRNDHGSDHRNDHRDDHRHP
jgi:ABC-type Zn2+ transport system substrate-binding protein/surface adhesin